MIPLNSNNQKDCSGILEQSLTVINNAATKNVIAIRKEVLHGENV